jgi:hypothetical protein
MPASPSSRANQKIDRAFRWRGEGVSRLEGLTDAVFAIVLALLFLRSEPPDNFADLFTAMKSLVPFAAMFAIIAYVWIESWLFSRRFALRDGWAMFLQLLLLFLLLFYAYPLKFLFTFLSVLLFGPIGDVTLHSIWVGAGPDAMQTLFVIYGIGYGSIFGLLALMYHRAAKLHERLELSEVELYITRGAMRQNLLQVGFAACSVAFAVAGIGIGVGGPGWVYACIGPVMAWHGVRQGRGVERLQKLAGPET